MNKVFTFLKKHFLLLAAFSMFCLTITYFIVLPTLQDYRTKKDIVHGELRYVPRIGWIDMRHANPSGPTNMVHAIDKHRGGTLTYSQDMKKRFLGLTFVVRMTNRYSIPKKMNKHQQEGILCFVFEDVSKDFEALQASHPFKASCGKAVGDINGDRLALLRSLYLPRPSCIDRPAAKSIALKKFESGKGLTTASSYLASFLPRKVKVYKYDSKVEYLLL